MALPLAKLCDIADFDDPQLLAAITTSSRERDAHAHAERKAWEVGMLARALEATGSLTRTRAR